MREDLSGDKLQLPRRKVEGAFLLTIYLFLLLLLLLLFIFTAANCEVKDLSLTTEVIIDNLQLALLQCVCVCVCVCAQSLSPVQLLFAALWINPSVACQAPLYMKFSRQEYWSGLLLHSPKDLPNPRTEPASLTSPALEDGFFTTTKWAGC